MTGYTRNDTSNNIANGNVVDADDLDGEFNAIVSAFNSSTGHKHDGTSAEGAPITVTGPAQEYLSDGTALYPKADDTYDLGKSTAEWKDLYLDGVANIDTLTADAGTVGGANIATVSATQTLTNKTIDSASNTVTVDLSEATVTGTLAEFNTALSDDNFVSLTGAETLTNKTLTSPDINGGTVDGATIGGTTPGAGTFTTLSASTSSVINLANNTSSGDLAVADGGTGASTAAGARTNLGLGSSAVADLLDEDDLVSDSDTDVPSQQSVKAYVDNVVGSLVTIPTGLITMWSGSVASIPVGWAICDGTNGTPDLTGKFVVHADADTGGTYAPGDTGGADSVTLSESEIPGHTHSFSDTTSSDSHTHTVTDSRVVQNNSGSLFIQAASGLSSDHYNIENTTRTTSSDSHTHSVSGTTGSTGGGSAHENRPPYYALAYIMKL